MGTITAPTKDIPSKSKKLVEMNWDPITRIVGSLGIFTKIDFENRHVAECQAPAVGRDAGHGLHLHYPAGDAEPRAFQDGRAARRHGEGHLTHPTGPDGDAGHARRLAVQI